MAKVGRPVIYNNKILEKARKYLHAKRDFDWWNRKKPVKRLFEDEEVVPTVAGLALKLGVSRETIYAWSKDDDKKEFSDILEQLLAKQERTLANAGLSGKFESPIVKVMLGRHGYADKTETDLTSGGKALSLEALEKGKSAVASFLNGKNTANNRKG